MRLVTKAFVQLGSPLPPLVLCHATASLAVQQLALILTENQITVIHFSVALNRVYRITWAKSPGVTPGLLISCFS
jgi:hypothetical protein